MSFTFNYSIVLIRNSKLNEREENKAIYFVYLPAVNEGSLEQLLVSGRSTDFVSVSLFNN